MIDRLNDWLNTILDRACFPLLFVTILVGIVAFVHH